MEIDFFFHVTVFFKLDFLGCEEPLLRVDGSLERGPRAWLLGKQEEAGL